MEPCRYDFYKVVDRGSELMGLERDEVLTPVKYKKGRHAVSYVMGPCARLASVKAFWNKSFPFLSRQ